MRKIFLYLLIATFLIQGVAFAAATTNNHYYPAYSNTIDIDGNGEIDQPPMRIKKVRYGACSPNNPSLTSGMIVKWDTASHDGVTVSACNAVTDAIAGVLVTDLLTQDSSDLGRDDNWGYMAVGGYCLVLLDTSCATTGKTLCPSTSVVTLPGYAGTANYAGDAGIDGVSHDVGILLYDPSVDGNSPCWLNLN